MSNIPTREYLANWEYRPGDEEARKELLDRMMALVDGLPRPGQAEPAPPPPPPEPVRRERVPVMPESTWSWPQAIDLPRRYLPETEPSAAPTRHALGRPGMVPDWGWDRPDPDYPTARYPEPPPEAPAPAQGGIQLGEFNIGEGPAAAERAALVESVRRRMEGVPAPAPTAAPQAAAPPAQAAGRGPARPAPASDIVPIDTARADRLAAEERMRAQEGFVPTEGPSTARHPDIPPLDMATADRRARDSRDNDRMMRAADEMDARGGPPVAAPGVPPPPSIDPTRLANDRLATAKQLEAIALRGGNGQSMTGRPGNAVTGGGRQPFLPLLGAAFLNAAGALGAPTAGQAAAILEARRRAQGGPGAMEPRDLLDERRLQLEERRLGIQEGLGKARQGLIAAQTRRADRQSPGVDDPSAPAADWQLQALEQLAPGTSWADAGMTAGAADEVLRGIRSGRFQNLGDETANMSLPELAEFNDNLNTEDAVRARGGWMTVDENGNVTFRPLSRWRGRSGGTVGPGGGGSRGLSDVEVALHADVHGLDAATARAELEAMSPRERARRIQSDQTARATAVRGEEAAARRTQPAGGVTLNYGDRVVWRATQSLSSPVVSKILDGWSEYTRLRGVLRRMLRTMRRYGTGERLVAAMGVPGTEAAELKTNHELVVNGLRELGKYGVPQRYELERIEGIAPAFDTLNIRGLTSAQRIYSALASQLQAAMTDWVSGYGFVREQGGER